MDDVFVLPTINWIQEQHFFTYQMNHFMIILHLSLIQYSCMKERKRFSLSGQINRNSFLVCTKITMYTNKVMFNQENGPREKQTEDKKKRQNLVFLFFFRPKKKKVNQMKKKNQTHQNCLFGAQFASCCFVFLVLLFFWKSLEGRNAWNDEDEVKEDSAKKRRKN